MISLSEFTPEVMALVDKCPPFVAERAILSAAIEFAEKTWCLNEEHDPFDLDAGEERYELDAPDLCRVVGIINLRIDGEPIYSISEKEIARIDSNWRSTTGMFPTRYISTAPTVTFYPVPDTDVDDAVTAKIAFAPLRTATKVDDRLRDYHFDAIVAGAGARLVLQSKKDWSAPSLVKVYRNIFMNYVYSARNVTMREIMQERPEKPGL